MRRSVAAIRVPVCDELTRAALDCMTWQYLCIVSDRHDAQREGTARIVLPFEGDATLSLILSKAFLLADDATITDPTIVRQRRSTGP